jgi:hypothetical protein
MNSMKKNDYNDHNTIIVSCAGDNELAISVYSFLRAEFPTVSISLMGERYILSLITTN